MEGCANVAPPTCCGGPFCFLVSRYPLRRVEERYWAEEFPDGTRAKLASFAKRNFLNARVTTVGFMTTPHRFRFSLRTLFVVVTVLAIGTGMLLSISRWRWSIESDLHRVRIGMTKSEVFQALGEPSQGNDHEWAYPDGFHDPYIISFNSNGKLECID